MVSKPGQKGGDVRFKKVKNDIGRFLKQRSDTYVTTFVDYYGTKEWPGLNSVNSGLSPADIAKHINGITAGKVISLFEDQRADKRFIPFITVHEFEALLFSDPKILSEQLGVNICKIENILAECGKPEAINNSPQTAPSKRLNALMDGKFSKTLNGIAIAEAIGVEKMREQCCVFDAWLTKLECLQSSSEK
jgi:hypothetical protein